MVAVHNIPSRLDTLYLPLLAFFRQNPTRSSDDVRSSDLLEFASSFEQPRDSNFTSPGRCWIPQEGIGRGYFWYYPIDDMMAINVIELDFFIDSIISYQTPDFLYFGKCNTSLASLLYGTTGSTRFLPTTRDKILSHASKRGTHTRIVKKEQPLRSTGITLLPQALQSLSLRFNCTPRAFVQAITELDGSQSIPGLEELFESLFLQHPSNQSARVFYESKITEALALLLDWHYLKQTKPPTSIKIIDNNALTDTVEYIHTHLDSPLCLDELCRVSCMSATKLTCLFKAVKGRTPIEYVRELRLEKACTLLRLTDISLNEIAQSLQYEHQGSFSEAFKTHFGVTPLSYRKSSSQHIETT